MYEIADIVNINHTHITVKVLKICTVNQTTLESECTTFARTHSRDTYSCWDQFTDSSIKQGDEKTQTQFIENKKRKNEKFVWHQSIGE